MSLQKETFVWGTESAQGDHSQPIKLHNYNFKNFDYAGTSKYKIYFRAKEMFAQSTRYKYLHAKNQLLSLINTKNKRSQWTVIFASTGRNYFGSAPFNGALWGHVSDFAGYVELTENS